MGRCRSGFEISSRNRRQFHVKKNRKEITSINFHLNCNSTNLVYLMSCKVCAVQYVGSTTTRFRLRFNKHESRIRAHARFSLDDKSRDDLIYQHFHGPAHYGTDRRSRYSVNRSCNKRDQLDREGQ